ncbi:MAG: hypothetical protein VXZ18_19325, partial [Pseudomonadota bacterium]|nr:hypothetical protein [Pseudomonadota bacterium]
GLPQTLPAFEELQENHRVPLAVPAAVLVPVMVTVVGLVDSDPGVHFFCSSAVVRVAGCGEGIRSA